MPISTALPATANPHPLQLDTQPTIDGIVPNEDIRSEDERTSSSSHSDSVGKSSTSSWPSEGDAAASHGGMFKHQRYSSIEFQKSCNWSEEKERTVRKPYDYIVSLGGKAFRREFLFALNAWLQVDEESCKVIDDVVSMLHNSSLLVDDIQDESKWRRGALSAHEVFGIAQTINAANYVYFEAQDRLRKLENWPQALLVFNEELLNLHRGQGMELHWRDTLQPPSEAEYLQMVGNKTGGLFRLILRLLQCGSSRINYDIEPLVDTIGLMFQILDDYKNLKDDKLNAEKGYCEDLTEGKFSFPISHAMWVDDPRKDEILRILKIKTTDDDVKAYVVQCLAESGSLAYTERVLEELYERARTILKGIPQRNPAVEALIEKMMLALKKAGA